MGLALNAAFSVYFLEADPSLSSPAASYLPDLCNLGQLIILSKDNSIWRCINGTNQSALQWIRMADITDIPTILPGSFSSPAFSNVTSIVRLSTTRDAVVNYVFPTSMTSLLTSQTLTATLQYADDFGFTANIVTVNVDVNGCSGILSLTLSGRLQVQGRIPAGKYRRVVLSQSGGATVPTSISSTQEVLL
jgi:hypothetical protein